MSSVLSPPTLFTPADLKSRPTLTNDITDLINDAFTRSMLPDPEKWEGAHQKRFPTRDTYFEMLGEEGVVTALFDGTRIVAVAAAVPWKGGWKKEGAGVEEGWEIKAVAVQGDEKYLHRGLAVQLYNSLEQYLIKREHSRLLKNNGKELENRTLTGHVPLWILAAECINGAYWRKRGFREARRDTCGPGTWGCLTSFEMVVLQKELTFDLVID
ncbi:hypothetical protein P171DRAFT_428307 [Karstenula rhodostoma CBS 690.94]|uniref:N-acetyltransferase domain-containing protein n=1 Tax=Karstenula rhodostoma CBS 690.94 TaxID=1392251 RepID=A0A9P4PRV3_9PLEO|nr:hypothetical protein P171DRAFT_428307 [Karstenula rhodostoma CBS 690.94]